MISTVEPVADKISLASESKSLLVLEEWINKLCDLYPVSYTHLTLPTILLV